MARTRKKSSFNLWSGNLEAYEVMYDFVCQIFPKYADAPWASRPKLPGFRGKDWDAKMLELAAAMNHHFADRRGSKSYSKGGVEIQLMYTLQQCINSKGYPFGDDQEWRKSFAISNLTNAIARGFIRPEHVHSFGLEWLGRFAEEPFLNDYFPKYTRQDLIDAGMAASVPKTKRRSTMAEKKSKKKTYDFDIEDYYKRINNLDRDEQIYLAIEAALDQLKTEKGMSVHELNCVKEVLNFLNKVKSSGFKVSWIKAKDLEIDPDLSQMRKENHSSDHIKTNTKTIADRGVDRPLVGYLKNPRTGKVIVINGCHRTSIVQELIAQGKLPEDFKVPVYLVPNEQEFLNHWMPILEDAQAWLNISAGTQAPVALADVRKYVKRQIDKSGIDVTSLPKKTKDLIKMPEYKRICDKAVAAHRRSTLAITEIKKAVTREFNESLKGSNEGIVNFSAEHPDLKETLRSDVGLIPISDTESYSIPNPRGDLIGTVSPSDTMQIIYLADAVGSTPMQTYLEKVPLAQRKNLKTALVFLAHNHKGEESKIFTNLEGKYNVAKHWYFHAKECFGEEKGNAVPDLIIVPNKIVDDCTVLIQGKHRSVKGSKENGAPIVITKDRLEAWFNSGIEEVPLSFMFRS